VSLQQLDPSDFEVIVVDDASYPTLAPVIHDYEQRAPKLRIVYVRNAENRGRAKSRNVGISKARGEILLFVDVDNVPAPSAFSAILGRFGDGAWRAVRGNVRCHAAAAASSAYVRFFDSRYLGARGVASGPLRPRYFASDALAINRDALAHIGTFDEDFRGYGCEDEELGCRVNSAGIPLCFAREAEFEDTNRPTLDREAKRMFDYARHAMPILLRKHPEYAAQCIFPALEAPAGRFGRLKRMLLMLALRQGIAASLMRALNGCDSASARMPAVFFFYVTASAYVAGYKGRKPPQLKSNA
jgi:glycosyltransferase involved in cell wall biosynthesis